jgi:transposase InsO family protein
MADWIDNFYNPARRHSPLAYLTPNEYEEKHPPQPMATFSE